MFICENCLKDFKNWENFMSDDSYKIKLCEMCKIIKSDCYNIQSKYLELKEGK